MDDTCRRGFAPEAWLAVLLALLAGPIQAAGAGPAVTKNTLTLYLGARGFSTVQLRVGDRDRGNQYYLDPKINGTVRRLMVDTGFSITTVAPAWTSKFPTLKSLGARSDDPLISFCDPASIVVLETMELPAVRLTRQPAQREDLRFRGGGDGFVGADFLIRHNAMLNIHEAKLHLRGSPLDAAGSTALDISMKQSGFTEVALGSAPHSIGVRFVEASVDGKPVRLLVDSGADVTTLDLGTVRRLGVGAKHTPLSGVGVRDRKAALVRVRLPTLQLGGLILTTVPVAAMDFGEFLKKEQRDHRSPRTAEAYDGLLGCEVLDACHAVIDLSRDKMFLKKVRDL